MKRKVLLACAAAAAAAALAAAFFLPAPGARPGFGEGELHVCLNDDGTVELAWPEAPAPARYRLDVRGSGENERLKFDYDSPGVVLEGLTLPMEIRIQAVAEGKNLLGMPRELTSARRLEAEVAYADLSAPQARGTPGPGKLSLSWTAALPAEGGALYEVFALEDGVPVHVATTDAGKLDLSVGREGDLALPGYGSPLAVNVRAGLQGEGYVLCGPASNLITVERQDLLGDELNLICREVTPMHYTLEWDETQGEYYELSEWNGEDWTLLETLEPAERFARELGRLVSGSRHRFQVTARDRNGTVRSSEETEFFASIDPLYATIWPIVDLELYERADKGSASLGKVPGGTALCVLEEQGDWFQVRYQDKYGYIDSRFCMINLPEYVGDHCEYDITNSYRSVFMVHENPIACITDQVISGFEHIQTTDEGFLVPYLYPCAGKLLEAAQAAEADGYRLRIYEAFRPNEATRFLYDTTAAQLDWAALVFDEEENAVDPVTGWAVDLADGLLTDPETDEKISREELAQQEEAEAPEDGEEAAQPEEGLPSEEDLPSEEAGENPEESAPALPGEEDDESGLQFSDGSVPEEPRPEEQPQEDGESEEPEEEPEPEYDTYFKIMTNNGRFHLGSFLARVTSAHNRGIALDLTLTEIDNGEELEMQSAIHDLSWYSATYLNNDNARLLEKYMTGVGMRGLTSEWWHFQDDETRESIGLSSYLYRGVSMGGWTRDERGWRYREEDGSLLRGVSRTIDGRHYSFDQDGYASE